MTCNMLAFAKVFLSGFNFESNALSKSGTKSCTESKKMLVHIPSQEILKGGGSGFIGGVQYLISLEGEGTVEEPSIFRFWAQKIFRKNHQRKA